MIVIATIPMMVVIVKEVGVAKDVRAAMVAGAAGLLSRRGVEGTSFNDVLEATGAPRGSLYHHFPGGKKELLRDAVRWVGSRMETALESSETPTPETTVDLFVGLWRRLLVGSDFDAGCAVAAVTVGAASDPDLVAATGEVFRGWTATLTRLLERGGMSNAKARQLAVTCLAAMEGAVILSRAERGLSPFNDVAAHLRAAARSSTLDT